MFGKPYLFISSPSRIHSYTAIVELGFFFQVFVINLLVTIVSSLKSLLVTYFNPKISRIAARFHRVFEPPLDWVWTIPTELARVWNGSVLLWSCFVCLHQFEVVLIQLISNPCSWTSKVRVCGTNLGIFFKLVEIKALFGSLLCHLN